MNLARHNLLQDKTRLGLSVSGVALAIALILLLNGFLSGMNQQITSYLVNSPGAIIVSQEGVRNLLGATSNLTPGVVDRVKSERGVSNVVPILSQFIILDLHEKKQPAYLIGYEPKRGGGPWKLVAGRQPKTDSEAVFDRVLTERHQLELGEKIEIMDDEFTIVGLSEGTTSWMTSFFFIRKSAAESLLRAPGASSFLLVTPQDGIAAETVRDRLVIQNGVEAQLKSEMAANDLKLFARIFLTPLRLMVGISFLVGTLIIGLVIYTATVERQREYGVLKAIGAKNRVLYRVVLAQALVAALAGAAAGVLLAYAIAQWIMAVRSQFLISFTPVDVGYALLSGLGMALMAALIPARVVGGLAPAEVFKK